MESKPTFSSDQWSLQLHQTFACLLNPKFNVSDDSILYLLLDKIKCIVSTEDLIRNSHIEWFVTSVLERRKSLNGTIISFVLHLVGWLGETESWFVTFKNTVEKSLTGFMKDTEFSNDFAILTAAYKSLSKIACHAVGLNWILTDLEDIIEKSYILLNSGCSIFVDRAILNFLATVWTSCAFWSEESLIFKGFSESTLKKTCQKLESTTKEYKSGRSNTASVRNPRLIPILQLVEVVCDKSDKLASEIMDSSQLLEIILDLTRTGNGVEGRLAMSLIKIFIKKSSDPQLTNKLKDFAGTFYSEGDVKKAQELTLCFLKKGDKVPSLTSRLLEPICVAVKEPDECCHTLLRDSRLLFIDRDILCHSISCLEKTDLPVTSDLAKLFKKTCRPCDAKEAALFGGPKLQKACLNYFLHKIGSGDLPQSVASDIVTSLLEIIRSLSVDHQTYSSCLKCLLPLFNTLLVSEVPANGNSKNLAEDLSDTIQHHLCAVQWEIRDTTLEFLGQVLEKYKDNLSVVDWFTCSHLHVHIWQCLLDSDSYVRATAISCISKMMTVPPAWQSLLTQKNLTEKELASKVLNILHSDTEAFPRRAAVKFLHSFYIHKVKVDEHCDVTIVIKTLMTSSKDLDWEVKLAGLDFTESLIVQEAVKLDRGGEDSIPSYAADLHVVKRTKLDKHETKETKIVCSVYELYLFGCWEILFQAIEDCDQTVCEKAEKILSDFSEVVKNGIGDRINEVKLEELDHILDKHFLEPEENAISNGEIGDDKKFLFNSDILLALNSKQISVDAALCNGDTANNVFNSKAPRLSATVRETLKAEVLKLVKRIANYERHVEMSLGSNYDTNPFSLLDDILSYSQKDEESNVVDCY